MIIEAKDFAGLVTGGRFRFGGASREQTIAALERLIEGVRDGRVLMQKATVSSEMGISDYTMTALTLTYAEQEEARPEIRDAVDAADGGTVNVRALYGADHQFPVEIRKG